MKNVVLLCFLCFQGVFNAQSIVLNELLVRNNLVFVDEFQNTETVLELFNRSTVSVPLTDYYLSDKGNNKTKFHLPNLNLNAGEHILIIIDNLDVIGINVHVNFKLDAGDTLFLFKNNLLEDQIVPVPHVLNTSYGRFPDGNLGAFQYQLTTLGNPNILGVSYFPTASSSFTIAGLNTVGGTVFLNNTSNTKYTVNGDAPTSTSQSYATTITVNDPNSFFNKWSMIPTNPGLVFPVGDYSENRANDRGWLAPYNHQDRLFLIRAKNFYANSISSEEFILPLFTHPSNSNLPIICLTTDSLDLFSNESGIYVYGANPDGNYNNSGREWERRAYLHHFNADGTLNQKLAVGLRISGGGSRHSLQKTMRMYARKTYDANDLMFNGIKRTKVTLRSGGHSPECVGRDYLGHQVAKTLDIEQANPQLCVVYLNGEYWGLHDLREYVDVDYMDEKYKLKKDEIILLDNLYNVKEGETSVPEDFRELTDWTDVNSLVLDQNYEYVADKVDIDNFINFYCTEIFLGNADFPTTNIEFWRVENAIGNSKWRFNLKDLDASFGGSCDTVYRSFNALNYNLQTSSAGWIRAGKLFRNLLTNEAFKLKFSLRMADLINSNYKSSVINQGLTKYQLDISQSRLDHLNRWRYPSVSTTLADRILEVPTLTKWDVVMNGLEVFYTKRPKTQRNNVMSQFGFTDSVTITLDVNSLNQGVIAFNSLVIDTFLIGANTIPYPWSGEYFQNVENNFIAAARPGYKLQSWTDGNAHATRTIASSSDETISAYFEPDLSYLPLLINEATTNNSTDYPDKYKQTEDWIELYNPNPYPIYLEGLYLTNNPFLLNQFKIPAGKESIIPANGYATFFASNVPKRGPKHLNFVLSSTGSTVYLVDRNATTVLSSKAIPAMNPGESFGTFPNGSAIWQIYTNTSPNANNDFAGLDENKNEIIAAYPNPTTGTLNFSMEGNYTVYSMDGKKLITEEKTKALNLSNLSNGVYLIRQVGRNESLKVIVQH